MARPGRTRHGRRRIVSRLMRRSLGDQEADALRAAIEKKLRSPLTARLRRLVRESRP